jgi:hypothetical protein
MEVVKMRVAQAMLRAIDSRGAVYSPYSFEGAWTNLEKTSVSAAINAHVPERVGAMFNNWRFTKSSDTFFMASRATWDRPIAESSAGDLAQRIADYYTS